MRKVVLSVGISLDQYVARKDGSVDWLSMDWDYDWMEFFGTIDTILMGRKSWDKTIEMSGGKKENPYKGTNVFVFSHSLKDAGVEGVEIISDGIMRFVEDLKSKDGKDIWLFGGGELTRSFLNENLVDEIYLGITPILLGSGLQIFPELEREIPLRLISCNTCKSTKDDNAMIDLRYEIIK